LTFLAAGSDLPTIPSIGFYLFCYLETICSHHSLSLRQGRCFDMPHSRYQLFSLALQLSACYVLLVHEVS